MNSQTHSPSDPTPIAFCVTDLDPGGAERALVQLMTRLDPARWQRRVICLSGPGELLQSLATAGVPTVCLGAGGGRDVRVVARLIRELRRDTPRLLQTWLYHANVAGRVAGRWAGVRRIVAGIRVAERRGRFRLWVDRATQGLVDHHVCVSRDVAEFSIHEGGLPREKVSVIPNGVDAAALAMAEPADLREFGIPAGSRTVLFVGRLDPQKDPLVLVEAAESLRPRFPDLHVLLVGEGPLRGAVQDRVARGGLADCVHLAGWRPDVPRLLRAAFALALPSRWEGMPNSLLEGMAAGLPVVATDVEGIREVIAPEQTGLVVSPRSPAELAAALARLLENPSDAARLGRSAQETVRKQFTWEEMASSYDALYRRLLHGAGGTGRQRVGSKNLEIPNS